MGPDPSTMCSTLGWLPRDKGLPSTGRDLQATPPAVWVPHDKSQHTHACGCHGARSPTCAVHSGLLQCKCPPWSNSIPLGTALIPIPLLLCTHSHTPPAEEGLHRHPAPAGSCTHTAPHLDGLLHPPHGGDGAHTPTAQAPAGTAPGQALLHAPNALHRASKALPPQQVLAHAPSGQALAHAPSEAFPQGTHSTDIRIPLGWALAQAPHGQAHAPADLTGSCTQS